MSISRLTVFSLIILFFSFLVFLFFSNPVQAPTLTTISIGSAEINVEIARSTEELLQGLSGRENVDGGMWFIFPKDDYYGIWMKEMLFPLDIIWVGNDLTVVHIEENVSPDSFPHTFKPSVKARYVLEVPAGFAAQHGVQKGTAVEFFER